MVNVLIKDSKKAIDKIENVILEIGDGYLPTVAKDGKDVRIIHNNCSEEKFYEFVRSQGLDKYLV